MSKNTFPLIAVKGAWSKFFRLLPNIKMVCFCLAIAIVLRSARYVHQTLRRSLDRGKAWA